VAAARAQGEPAYVESFWGKLFPARIPQPVAFPEVLDGNAIELDDIGWRSSTRASPIPSKRRRCGSPTFA
jgi:hypothetical protein